MTTLMPTTDSYSLLLGLLVSSIAHVRSAETLATTKGEPILDAVALGYARVNEMLSQIARHGGGHLRVEFRLDLQKSRMPMSAIRLTVRSEDGDHAVDLDDGGRFTLPTLSVAEASTAYLITNVPQQRLVIYGSLELTASPRQLTMAAVRRVMRAASVLRQRALPWHLQWLLPQVIGVRVCSARPDWKLKWRESAQVLDLVLPVVEGQSNPQARKGEFDWPCTVLAGDAWWGDTARLVAPPGTRLSLKFEGQ